MEIYYNCTIVTMNDKFEVINNGYLIVSDDGTFAEVGTGFPRQYEREKTKAVNLNGKWVLPGLINTHCHTGMSLLRGYSDDLVLKKWLEEKIWPMERKLTKEAVLAGTNLAILEMIKSGTTAFLDMYHLYLDDVGELVRQYGLRAVLTRGMIGLCSEQEQQEKLNEATALVKRWQGEADGRITTMLSPHAPYTCPPAFIEMIAQAALELAVPLHTHVAETRDEVQEHKRKYKKSPIQHLFELGFFEGKSLLAHGVFVEEDEYDILRTNHVSISHNPLSNLKLGSGIAPISHYIDKNINVSLGTDSVASNNNLDLFQEVRTALLLQKGVQEDPTILTAEEGLKIVTRNGARALDLTNVGQIVQGYEADFITIDVNAPHLQPTAHLLSHLVYAASGADVADVFVKGKHLMKDRECLTLDEEKIVYEANEALKKLLH